MPSWNTPTTTADYLDVLDGLKARDAAVGSMDFTGWTDLPSGLRRFNASNYKIESWNGSAWSAVTESLNALLKPANNLSDVVNAATARTNLGLGSLSTLSSVNNTNWSGTPLSVANGGTGATTTAAARAALGLGALATLSNVNNTHWSGDVLSIANGGTGFSSAGGARINLGLGTMATQNADAVVISNGNATLNTLTASTAYSNNWSGASATDMVVALIGENELQIRSNSGFMWRFGPLASGAYLFPHNNLTSDIGGPSNYVRDIYAQRFYPATRPNYTESGTSTLRSISASSSTTDVRNIVGTLINDLIAIGFLQ